MKRVKKREKTGEKSERRGELTAVSGTSETEQGEDGGGKVHRTRILALWSPFSKSAYSDENKTKQNRNVQNFILQRKKLTHLLFLQLPV